jgi:hypothetical protein
MHTGGIGGTSSGDSLVAGVPHLPGAWRLLQQPVASLNTRLLPLLLLEVVVACEAAQVEFTDSLTQRLQNRLGERPVENTSRLS